MLRHSENRLIPQYSCLLGLLMAASCGRTPAIRYWANEALRWGAGLLPAVCACCVHALLPSPLYSSPRLPTLNPCLQICAQAHGGAAAPAACRSPVGALPGAPAGTHPLQGSRVAVCGNIPPTRQPHRLPPRVPGRQVERLRWHLAGGDGVPFYLLIPVSQSILMAV